MSNKIDLYCELCDFKAIRPTELLRHLQTQKHKRNGQPKTKCCDQCDKIFINHFKLKIHKLSQHATIEEKRKHKYYCRLCDLIFISKIFMINHILGKHHKTKVKIYEIMNKNQDDIIHMQKIYEYYKIKKYINENIANKNNILFEDLQLIYKIKL